MGSNLANWVSGGTKRQELDETKAAWERTEALWRASPFGENDRTDIERNFIDRLARRQDRPPAFRILYETVMALGDALDQEDVGPIEVTWPIVAERLESAVYLRQLMDRRRLWVSEPAKMLEIAFSRFLDAYDALYRALPEPCFEDWDDEDGTFSTPLIELVEDPADLIRKLIEAPYDEDTLRLDLLRRVRKTLERNLLLASGFPPDTDPRDVQQRFVWPEKQKGKSPTELAEIYLADTPFLRLVMLPVPFHIPDEARFEHCHIVGGTGHGKTQLMQRMIHADLLAAAEDSRSVIVIDSQGDLINKVVRLDLFDPDRRHSLWDRLVLIDPADVEFPAALNLFDAHLERLADYSAVDRERVLNGVVELYEGFFGDLLGAELTQKQGVIFRYLARLMLTIPDATIHTLMQLMADGKPYRPYMQKLEGSARYFFETEFFHPSFAATKKQILKRLWGVLSTPAFERMFAQKKNKLDLFEAMQSGKIILISTAKDLLKTEGSQLFGRFFIALLAQAALERSTVSPEDRTPTHVYIDEAQEYFDDSIETILNQARKYRVGLTLAHQTLDQLAPRLRSALHSNTSLKCVGGVSARDARAFAEELRTTPDFIESMKRRKGRTEFATWLKHRTPQAIRLSVPLGFIEQQPLLSEEAFEDLMERNRAQYCGTMAEVSSFEFETPNEAPVPVRERVSPAPELEAEAVDDLREPPAPLPEGDPPWRPSTPRPTRPARDMPQLGKGGSQHRYVQHLVKGLAEERGFRAVIEEPIEGGQVDVALHREGLAIACEISVTSKPDYEAQNLAKCLRGPFAWVFAIAADAKRLRAIEASARASLSDAEIARIQFLLSEDVSAALDALAVPSTEESVVRGYRVKVSRASVGAAEAKDRRATVARVIAQSLRGMKET